MFISLGVRQYRERTIFIYPHPQMNNELSFLAIFYHSYPPPFDEDEAENSHILHARERDRERRRYNISHVFRSWQCHGVGSDAFIRLRLVVADILLTFTSSPLPLFVIDEDHDLTAETKQGQCSRSGNIVIRCAEWPCNEFRSCRG